MAWGPKFSHVPALYSTVTTNSKGGYLLRTQPKEELLDAKGLDRKQERRFPGLAKETNLFTWRKLRHLLFRGSFAHTYGGKKLAAVSLINNIYKEQNALTYLIGIVGAYDTLDTCATANQNQNLAAFSPGTM